MGLLGMGYGLLAIGRYVLDTLPSLQGRSPYFESLRPPEARGQQSTANSQQPIALITLHHPLFADGNDANSPA